MLNLTSTARKTVTLSGHNINLQINKHILILLKRESVTLKFLQLHMTIKTITIIQ